MSLLYSPPKNSSSGLMSVVACGILLYINRILASPSFNHVAGPIFSLLVLRSALSVLLPHLKQGDKVG